jgi:hypothetical protein
MTSPAKKKNNNADVDKLTAEFTSGQLVIGICVSLFLCLVCFLSGVLVGRYQPHQAITREKRTGGEAPAPVSTIPEEETAKPQISKSAPPGPKAANEAHGTQTSPRPIRTAQTRSEPAAAKPAALEKKTTPDEKQEKESTDFLNPGLRTGPRITRLPPLPPTRPKPAAAAANPDKISKPASPGGETEPFQLIPLPEMPPVDEEEPGSEKTAAAAEKKPAAKENNAAQPEKPASAGKTSPVPASPGWGVQLASFQGPDKEKNARDYLRRLKENADITAERFTSADNQYCRVIITGYQSRDEAAKASLEIRKKAGFADAFVSRVPPG